jgi:hypothetical protein
VSAVGLTAPDSMCLYALGFNPWDYAGICREKFKPTHYNAFRTGIVSGVMLYLGKSVGYLSFIFEDVNWPKIACLRKTRFQDPG